MIEIVHASVRGRARYHYRGLYRSPSWKERLEKELLEQDAIQFACASILTGNILVHYNSGNTAGSIALTIKEIASKLGFNTDEPEAKPGKYLVRKTRRRAKAVNRSDPGFPRNICDSPPEIQPLNQWHTMNAGEVLAEWNVSPLSGLSTGEVFSNSKKFGRNVLPGSIPRSRLGMFFSQFQSLPVVLLGAAAAVSILTGGAADAVVIVGVVGINAIIGYVTESQAERTIESLKNIVRPTVLVVRDTMQSTIGIEEIVPGDVLVLRPGVYVPADARLIEADHLSLDESALTGESLPVIKTVEALTRPDVPMADRKNMIYMGTLVTGGQGIAVVVATGRFTELGKLQLMVGEARAPETPMEKELRRVGNQLVLISGCICGSVFLIGLIRGSGFIEVLKTSIALAVAAVPEGLPAVATTTLALGIRNMKKRNVLIRRLDAVETLGSVQTICFDKTGTVTQNKMSVKRIWVMDRALEMANGKFAEECGADTLACEALLRLLLVCVLCNESEIIREGTDYVLHGSSTENALIHAALAANVDVAALRKHHRLVSVNHRSEDRHFMGTLHESPGGERLFSLKGNPVDVLSMCEWHLTEGEIVPLTDDIRLSIEAENERMAGDALRVLGFAYHSQTDALSFETPRGLIWLGLVGMADPVREGVKDLMPLFHGAGIDTVMITGDQSSTAYSIGKELDLSNGRPLDILDSSTLSDIDPDALKALAQRVHVFARVSPAHKLQIVQALQKAGRVVAMTGDGINDAPALKAADIGVALGASGTDVAREVADVILEKDDLETMILAVGHGRTIYSNIRKALHFLLATNFSEIMVMFAAGATGIGYPLSARQLLWINLISDIFPGLALAMEAPEPDVLKKPPRDPHETIVRKADFKNITREAVFISGGAMFSYLYGLSRFGMGPHAGTLAFQSLSLSQLLHAISCRSERRGIFTKEELPSNEYLNWALGGSFGIQFMTMVLPGLRSLLGLTPIGLADAVVIGASSVVPLLLNEVRKAIPKDSPL